MHTEDGFNFYFLPKYDNKADICLFVSSDLSVDPRCIRTIKIPRFVFYSGEVYEVNKIICGGCYGCPYPTPAFNFSNLETVVLPSENVLVEEGAFNENVKIVTSEEQHETAASVSPYDPYNSRSHHRGPSDDTIVGYNEFVSDQYNRDCDDSTNP